MSNPTRRTERLPARLRRALRAEEGPASLLAFWPMLDLSGGEERVWLTWLVRLRWVAILAQLMTLALAARVLASPIIALPLLLVVALLVVGNLRALAALTERRAIASEQLTLQLGLDVLALTTFFVLGGGQENPFTMLYVVHVAMAAVMLQPGHAATIAGLCLTCYGAIHLYHLPLHLDQHTFSERTLINLGRVVAFAITVVSVSLFVIGVTTTLRARERDLLQARDRTARTDRLRAVGTLAAGAAHELNTPLSTLGLRLRRIGRRYTDPDTAADVEAMRTQLERCTEIVRRLLVGAGDPSASDIAAWEAGVLVQQAIGWWTKSTALEVRFEDQSDGARIEVPQVAFTQALVNLLENAREALAEAGRSAPIEVELSVEPGAVVIVVRDRGVGLPGEKDRVGDPFFTTKVTGTGLGVFVARQVADGSGGGLRYAPVPGGGTEAIWWFPPAAKDTETAR